jgi:hypothetical protein
MELRDPSKNADRWKRNTIGAVTSYQEGVNDPKKDWAANTKAAEKSYEEGVQGAIARKSFGRGVTKAGTEAWQQGASGKGAARFAGGVDASGDNYRIGFAPYHDVLAKTTLPPRGAKGSDANYERVKAVGKALRARKLQG